MKNKISKSDFQFKQLDYGYYYVTYTSPKTNIKWSTVITDMELLDKTKNIEKPKIQDLENLKRYCKCY